MKNTNKFDDLDKYTVTPPPPAQNDHQEPGSLSKRRIIASIGLTSGVLGATALSQNWVKPAVSSVILPAHAQTTGATATQPPATQPPADPNRFEVGDTVEGFPAGVPSGTISGAAVSISGGRQTVDFSNGGSIALSDSTYTCQSAGGCQIVDRVVTEGTIVRS